MLISSHSPKHAYFGINSLINLCNRVHLVKMVALDPLVPLELEASLESWDSQDPREQL